MFKPVIPYKYSKEGKKQQITTMFNTISKGYDGLNRIISFGIDKKWRKKVAQVVGYKQPKSILDIATGTGDLAIVLAKNTNAEKIIGLDIAAKMLDVGKEKIANKNLSNRIEMVLGDSEKLPFNENSFDAITVAFGVRNFENLEKGLREIYRVLKPNGTFVVLETSVPTKTPFKQGYHFYTRKSFRILEKFLQKTFPLINTYANQQLFFHTAKHSTIFYKKQGLLM